MYTLTINISAQGIQFLTDNKEQIVIVYPTATEHAIACFSFLPFGNANTLVFQGQWFEFASAQMIADYKVITLNMAKDVNVNNTYAFTGTAFSGNGAAPVNQFGLLNQSPLSVTAGLGQYLALNGNPAVKCPVNMATIPVQQTAYFEPGTIIWIFLASGIDTNMIFPAQILKPTNNIMGRTITMGGYLEIDLTATTSVTYSTTTNAFTAD